MASQGDRGAHVMSKAQLDAFEDVWEGKLSYMAICRKHGINRNTLINWRNTQVWRNYWAERERDYKQQQMQQAREGLRIFNEQVRRLAEGKGDKRRMHPKTLQLIPGASEPVPYADQVRAAGLLLRQAELTGVLLDREAPQQAGGLRDALLGRAACAPDAATEEESEED